MSTAEGFFPERLVLRLRAARSQAVTGSADASSAAASAGTSPWVWFVVFMPTWIAGGFGASTWRITPGVVAHVLRDSLLRNGLIACLYALAGLALGAVGLAVYLAIKGRGTHRPA